MLLCRHMVRTSLVLPASLQQRLHIEAKSESKKVAELIREILDKALLIREQVRTERTYKALEKVKGVCKDPNLTDVSTTINETLYGEQGAWKGQDD